MDLVGFAIFLLLSCGYLVMSNHRVGTYVKSCYSCDTMKEDFGNPSNCLKMSDSSRKVKLSGAGDTGVFGWPLCYTEMSSDKSVIKRGIIQRNDGTAYWKPIGWADACKKYTDHHLGPAHQLNMTACYCFKDNCNKD